MPQVVQDEAGSYFIDQGGGIYQPVSEQEARTYQAGEGAGTGAAMAAAQGAINLGTGIGALLSDNPEWLEANKAGRRQSDVLNMANPITSGAAQFAPQALLGLGAGSVPAAAAIEGLLGAATTPEAPIQGAALGALLGGAGAAIPGAASATYRAGRNKIDDLGWFGQGTSKLADDLPPGYARPGDSDPVMDSLGTAGPESSPGAAVVPPPAAAAPASPFTDLAADMSGPPLQARPSGAAADAVGDLPLSSRQVVQPQTRMAERVTQRLSDADPELGQQLAPVRVAGDMMTPDELGQYGIPLNRGQYDYLTATTADRGAAGRARALMRDEEARRSSPALGRKINENIDAQVEASTNFVADQMGLPPGVALTDGTVSELMAGIGGRMDQIAEQMGGVPITKEIRDELAETMRLSAGRHTNALQQTIDFALQKADNNGGMLDGQAWQTMRTDLNKQIIKGMKDGKIDWVNEASDVMDTMARAMESRLPTEVQRELRQLRKQYAIGATLSKPGTRNPQGMVNPTSFYSNWKRPQSMKHRGKDDVGRFMNTMNFLISRPVPESGTATRLGRMLEGTVESIPGLGGLYKGLTSP